MDNSGIYALLFFAFLGILWILPLLIIMFSKKTSGAEKIAWLLAVLFVSWFAWIFYWLLAPIKKIN